MNALQKLGDATRMLSEVRTAHDAKKLMNMASAAEYYARKAKLGAEAIGYAHTIKTDAMELLGGFLVKAVRRGKRGKDKVSDEYLIPPGISKMESSAAQALHAIAKESPEQFEAIRSGSTTLQKAKQERKREAKQSLAKEIKREPQPEPLGPFRVIVIDPPWKYGSRAEDLTHRARNPYPDMALDEIKALPLPTYAHTDCILWLWTTNAFMREAFECLDSWGFEQKTILTWAKDRMGLGDWLRGQTEHCLMAVRGKPIVTLTNQTTALISPAREHSRKPDEFYRLVESLCPGSKLEIFARELRADWQSWGAEAGKFTAE